MVCRLRTAKPETPDAQATLRNRFATSKRAQKEKDHRSDRWSLDGVDDLYMNYLDRLFDDIEQRYGDAIDWTTLGRLAISLFASSPTLLPERTATQPIASRAAWLKTDEANSSTK
jgi:hypothetical protein